MEESSKQLKGIDLFLFMTESICDEEYLSVLNLLPVATCYDMDKACEILERVQEKGKRLIAIYPGLGEKPTPEMELVGSIMDGALYIK